uniref:ATP synthase F0 subunit 8 n=1 Tax=Plectus sambesii TaxID=2011161 RepID=A0A914WEJ9_9BILA
MHSQQNEGVEPTFDYSSAVFLVVALIFLFIILFMVLYLCYKYIRRFPVGEDSPSLLSMPTSTQRSSFKPPDDRNIGTVGPGGYRYSVA